MFRRAIDHIHIIETQSRDRLNESETRNDERDEKHEREAQHENARNAVNRFENVA